MMQAVSKKLQEIVSEIFEIQELKGFYLAGGTNLALKYGHRISTDIDLFTQNKDRWIEVQEILEQKFGQRIILKSVVKDTIRTTIDGIKVDFLCWNTIKKMLFNTEDFENKNWKLASDLDVAAMKISAIINRGTKKDFYDLALLIKKHSLLEIINAYLEKYQITTDSEVLKYITNFFEADLESEKSIQILDFPIKNWEEVKQFIIKETSLYLIKK